MVNNAFDRLAFAALAAIALITCGHRLLIWCSAASSTRLRFPWLLVGTLAGFLVGLTFMPAEARIGLPIHYAALPVGGAIAGAVMGAIREARVRRRLETSDRE